MTEAGEGNPVPTRLGTSVSAVVAMDTEGRVITLNPTAEELFGISTHRAVGLSYERVLGQSLASRILPLYLANVRHRQSATPRAVNATLSSGRRVGLRATLGPIIDTKGNYVGVLFVADEVVEGDSTAAVTERLRRALHLYLGDELASMVESRPSFVGVGGQKTVISVLHADVRGYTTAAEQLDPEETVLLLLRYHSAVVNALQEHGATLDRFIGDSVLAFWNAPHSAEDHARRALESGLAILASVRSLGSELRYGVGVNTGEAVVGNIGTDSFQNFTAVGDTVNVAARLQAEAGPGELVCAAATLEQAGVGFITNHLGSITLRGRRQLIDAFQVTGVSEAMQ